MRVSPSLIVVSVLSVAAGVRPLQSQSLSWWAQCTPGAFRACVSVQVWNAFDPATGTHSLNVSMTNLQGAQGFTDLSPAGLAIFQVRNLVTTGTLTPEELNSHLSGGGPAQYGAVSGDVQLCSPVVTGPCTPATDDMVQVDWSAFGLANGQAVVDASLQSQSWSLLWGCGRPSTDSWGAVFTSCPGTVTWSLRFTDGRPVMLTGQSAVHIAFRDESLGGASCTTGVDCVTVTPEPGTLILLGSGVAGLAAWRRQRRRRGS